MKYKPYPEYKDSGVDWLGKVPAHWSASRLKWSVAHTRNGIWGDEAEGSADTACIRVADFDRTKLRIDGDNLTYRHFDEDELRGHLLETGDLIIEKSGGGENQLVGCVVLFDQDFVAVNSNFCAKMTVETGMNPNFWAYAHHGLYSGRLNYPAIKQTTGIQNLDIEHYLNLRVAYPPESEQVGIAAFLDHKTAQIDALIAKKKALIERLAEKRIAVITQAVTRGLDPTVALKDSGVEWLGKVPEHWTLNYKLAFLSASQANSFVNGPFGSDLLTTELVDEGIRVIYSGDVKPLVFTGKSQKFVTNEKALELDFCRVDPLDVLLAKVGDPPGDACVYPSGAVPGIVTQDVVRIRVDRKTVNPFFLAYLLVSEVGRHLVRLVSVESTRGRFSLADLKSIRFPLPSLEEQEETVAQTSFLLEKVQHVADVAQTAISRLTEYRSALITAATTGQIDVRDVVLPEGVAP